MKKGDYIMNIDDEMKRKVRKEVDRYHTLLKKALDKNIEAVVEVYADYFKEFALFLNNRDHTVIAEITWQGMEIVADTRHERTSMKDRRRIVQDGLQEMDNLIEKKGLMNKLKESMETTV